MTESVKAVGHFLKIEFLALAFVGALFALSFWPPSDWRRGAASVIIGTVLSAVTTPAVFVWLAWKWPGFPQADILTAAAYFWIGLFGMQVVPVVEFVLKRFREARIPEGQ